MPYFGAISHPDIGVVKMRKKKAALLFAIGPREGGPWSGGELVAISPGSAGNRGPAVGTYRALFLATNRG